MGRHQSGVSFDAHDPTPRATGDAAGLRLPVWSVNSFRIDVHLISSVQFAGTIFRLKGCILTMSFLDCNGALIPYSYEPWKDENKESRKEQTRGKYPIVVAVGLGYNVLGTLGAKVLGLFNVTENREEVKAN